MPGKKPRQRAQQLLKQNGGKHELSPRVENFTGPNGTHYKGLNITNLKYYFPQHTSKEVVNLWEQD